MKYKIKLYFYTDDNGVSCISNYIKFREIETISSIKDHEQLHKIKDINDIKPNKKYFTYPTSMYWIDVYPLVPVLNKLVYFTDNIKSHKLKGEYISLQIRRGDKFLPECGGIDKRKYNDGKITKFIESMKNKETIYIFSDDKKI